MNSLVRKFFTENDDLSFSKVIFLSEEKEAKWEEMSRKAPRLPRGWFELSRVSERDRVEFTRDFWLDRLPYHPSAHPGFFEFFEQMDDVTVVLYQMKEGEPFEAQLVYSLADNSCFFRGNAPASDEAIFEMQKEIGLALPRDYLAFLKLHDGFGKLSEMGLLEVEEVPYARRRVMDLMLRTDKRITSDGKDVDPSALIPFYEVLGLSSFQCFYTDWYPSNEMGNVYLSGIDYTISDVAEKRAWNEQFAFASFSEWLSFYLQGMNLCI